MGNRKTEEEVIGDLKRQFVKGSHRSQIHMKVSPTEISGNIALGYYRGLAVGEERRTKAVISLLKKKYPKAADLIKNSFLK
jgi:hypothetical protein